MSSSLRFAAAMCCLILALAACAKTAQETSGSSSAATPAADASPSGAATSDAASPPAPTGAPNAFIDVPLYPGATEAKDQGMSMAANATSIAVKVYSSTDDAKKIADWYEAHLPSTWTKHVLTSDGKTVGTFSSEGADGNQSVIVGAVTAGSVRIQVATKHGR